MDRNYSPCSTLTLKATLAQMARLRAAIFIMIRKLEGGSERVNATPQPNHVATTTLSPLTEMLHAVAIPMIGEQLRLLDRQVIREEQPALVL